ncbi:MAG: VCBS repeat-containing protein, partial [Thermoplasmata archaeon]|nr:VCBS repeat-containing protein [Thermoplasmata archaeon]
MKKNPLKTKTMRLMAAIIVIVLLTTSIGYHLYESDDEGKFEKNMRILPGEFSYVKVRGDEGSGMTQPLPPFPKNVKSAINRVPGWLKRDLEKKFVELSQKNIHVSTRGTPSLADFDLDGDYDLIVGSGDGNVYFKENTGSNYYPIFTPTELTDSISVESNSAPAIVDLNGDGNTDLVVGRQDGTLTYYRNEGDNRKPVWKEDDTVFAGIDAGRNSRPVFVDYDRDGDFDLIVGGNTNRVTWLYYYENSGTPEEPDWEIRPEEFTLLEPGILDYPFPAIADMDNDGDFDLTLGGRDGRLRNFENTGDIYATIWREVPSLYPDIDVGRMACPSFADINGDSRIDLIVGNNNGTFFSFPNHGTPEHPRFVALSTGTIYCSGSAGEIASE